MLIFCEASPREKDSRESLFFSLTMLYLAHGSRVFLSHGIDASIPPWKALLGNAYMGSSKKDTYMWNRQSECAVQYLIAARNIAEHFTHVSMFFFTTKLLSVFLCNQFRKLFVFAGRWAHVIDWDFGFDAWRGRVKA